MEAQRNDNWSPAEFYQALTACIEAETDVLGPAVQETAVRATEPRHLLTRVSFFREELAVEEWDYDDFLLRREILDRNTLLSRLVALQQGRLISGPDELPLSSPNPGHSYWPEASRSQYTCSPWPCMIFEVRPINLQVPYGRLLKPPLPAFPSPLAALRSFFRYPFHDHDARIGYVLFFVPNYRARLQTIELANQQLRTTVKTSLALTDLFLQVSSPTPQTVVPTSDTTTLTLATAPQEINVFLTSQHFGLMDWFEESGAYTQAGWESILTRDRQAAVTDPLFRTPQSHTLPSKRIFVVHGHDVASRAAVAQHLTKLGLEPVILDEQANAGRTIIEKFEDHAQEVQFAIVLLTPDDQGSAVSATTLQPRARQNVILELGYFLGKLGRTRVAALYKGVELPSDYRGILYTQLDEHGAWQFKLAKELKTAGYDIDLNML